MYLDQLFKEAPHIIIEQLSCDSRVPMKNCIFFCISGVKYDGHEYIQEAISNGASVIVYTKEHIETSLNAVFIKVKDINYVFSNAAKIFYEFDPMKLDIFLTCGCYGKSSVSLYINQLLKNVKKIAYIGYYGIKYDDKELTYPSQTLTLFDNYRYLADIAKSDYKACTLEINARSLSYNKVDGLNPKYFIYTNTSHFSKDYKGFSHKYFDSIRRYLYTLDDTTTFIFNRDDISYNEIASAAGNRIVSYGFSDKSTYVISNVKYYIDHTTFDLSIDDNKYSIDSPLLALSNVYNLTAAIVSILENGIDFDTINKEIKNLKEPDGIMNKLYINDRKVLIDYCYSTDLFSNISNFIKNIEGISKIYFIMSVNDTENQAIIKSYFDSIKDISYLTIFTENVSYDKNIHELLDMANECAKGYNHLLIEDRTLAIQTAIDLLNSNDLLVILGKGNEKFFFKNYQKVIYEGDYEISLKYISDYISEN